MINQRLYYFVPVYITSGGGVITKMPFIGIVDALTRDVAIGLDSSQAFYSLIKQIPVEQPEETQRIHNVYTAFSSHGYNPINVTALYPEVFVQKDSLSYLVPQDQQDMETRIIFFINNYVKVFGGDIYSWMSEGNIINFGVFNITPRGIKELYYLS